MTNLRDAVEAVLARTPDWIRNDLSSKESSDRKRAEEALAAMIQAVLEGSPEHGKVH